LGSADVVALASINTTLSAAGGTISALAVLMYLEYMDSGHVVYDLVGASNGTLGGLVAITSGCAVVEVLFHMQPYIVP
jgi:ammonia channel protein AmtB